MKDKLLMDNPNKLKITLIRNWRINFRYNNQLYSLQYNDDDYEDTIYLNIFKDNEWITINSQLGSLYNKNLITMHNNEKFKRNVVYSHIDKQHFLKELHEYGFIYAGDKIELKKLNSELKQNLEYAKYIEKEYREEMLKNLFFRNEIIKQISKLENEIRR